MKCTQFRAMVSGILKETKMSQVHVGGCLCGGVRFKTTGRLRGVIYCHCTQCRRQSGHFVAATSASDTGLAVGDTGHPAGYAAPGAARRGSCPTCASPLFWKRMGAPPTAILAGASDRPSGLAGARPTFVADKGDYSATCDGLPQFAGDDTAVAVARG